VAPAEQITLMHVPLNDLVFVGPLCHFMILTLEISSYQQVFNQATAFNPNALTLFYMVVLN
jgi:hypothetical protein